MLPAPDLLLHLQQVFGPDLQVQQVGTFDTGMAFPVHRVVFEGQGNTRTVVMKFFPPGFEQAAHKEAWALQNLGHHGIAVPALQGVSEVQGTHAVVMAWVEGPALMARLQEDPARWLPAFAGMLHRLHQLPVEQLELPSTESAFSPGLQPVLDFCAQQHPNLLPWVKEQLSHTPPLPTALLHGDYHPWNVLVAPQGWVVLDWNWQLGDPRSDLHWTCMLLEKAGQPALAAGFLQAYGSWNPAALEGQALFEVLTHLRWLHILSQPRARDLGDQNAIAWMEVLRQHTVQAIEKHTGIRI